MGKLLQPGRISHGPVLFLSPPNVSDRLDFRHLYTARRRLPAPSFENALFSECAPLRVLLLTLVFDGSQLRLFALDRALIARVAGARCLEDVETAIADALANPANDTWLRRAAWFRLSTRRLRRIAAECLPLSAISAS